MTASAHSENVTTSADDKRVWVGPLAMAGVFLTVVIVLVGLVHLQLVQRRSADLDNELGLITRTLRQEFAEDLRILADIADSPSTFDPAAVDRRQMARQLVDRSRAVDHVFCYDADLNRLWIESRQGSEVPPPGPVSAEPTRAARQALATGQPEYTSPFRCVDGQLRVALFVPCVQDSDCVVACAYDLAGLLDEVILPILGENYHVALRLDPGNILCESETTGTPHIRLSRQLSLDPPGHGLSLIVTAYRAEIFGPVLMLLLVCVGLGMGLAWTTYALRRKLVEVRRARDQLRQSREGLELTVSERTDALARSNRELQRDVSERRVAEEALRRSESTLRSILIAAPLGIALYRDGEIEWCNDCLAGMFDDGSGDKSGFAKKPDCPARDIFRAALEQPEFDSVIEEEIPLRRRDGSEFIGRIHLAPLNPDEPTRAILGVVQDVSERRQSEIRLRRAQKMQAIGTLAGGIAHDFNNILYAMMGYVQIAKDDAAELDESGEIGAHLGQVILAGQRAADLVQQILVFANQDETDRQPLKLQEILSETVKLLRGSLPATIELAIDIDHGCGRIMAEATQMHQVFMNLGTNAFHAMLEKGGVLTITLRERRLSPAEVTSLDGLSPARYAVLTISDTGCGMDRATCERIFEPYFTTKDIGEGSGVGLATVHAIVAAHGGTITADSELGFGSTFEIYLPVICAEEEDPAEREGASSDRPHGRGVVMLIDDEEMIVELGREFLARLGYEVVHFHDSPAALEAFRQEPDRYDLVITDNTMPRLTGLDLAHEILTLRPDQSIVLTSGYSDQALREKARDIGVTEFLAKPIRPERLARVIARVLGGREAQA